MLKQFGRKSEFQLLPEEVFLILMLKKNKNMTRDVYNIFPIRKFNQNWSTFLDAKICDTYTLMLFIFMIFSVMK